MFVIIVNLDFSYKQTKIDREIFNLNKFEHVFSFHLINYLFLKELVIAFTKTKSNLNIDSLILTLDWIRMN